MPVAEKTRSIEIVRLWDDKTWDTEFYDVPESWLCSGASDPELRDKIREFVLESMRNSADLPVYIDVWWIPDKGDEVEEENEDPDGAES